MNERRFSFYAALLLIAGVSLGAFGAHGLNDVLDTAYRVEIYEKAVFYHFVHALGLLLVSLLATTGVISRDIEKRVGLALVFGVVIFSGSLYLLAITEIKWLGAITPIGGALFIVAWAYLAYCLGLSKTSS